MITLLRPHLLLLALTLVFSLPATAQQATFDQLGHWTAGPAQAVVTDGSTVYYSGSANLNVADFSDPAAPEVLGSVDLSGVAAALAMAGDYAYVGQHDGTVSVVDISDPAAPALAASLSMQDVVFEDVAAVDVAVAGQHLYVLTRSSSYRGTLTVHVYDVASPEAPAFEGSLEVGERRSNQLPRMAVAGDHVYIGEDESLRIVDVSDPTAPEEATRFEFSAPRFVSAAAEAVAVAGDYAYVSATDTLRVLDVSDPAAPEQVGALPTRIGAARIAIRGDHAFIGDQDEDPGLLVIDVSDPTAPTELGHYETGSFGTNPAVNDVAVDGDLAYLANGAAGVVAIDVADVSDQSEAGTLYTGEDAIEVVVSGDYAYVMQSRDASLNSGATTAIGDALRIVDISNPTSPQTTGALEIDGEAHGIAVRGTTVFMARGHDGLVIVDASDPSDPQQVGALDDPAMDLLLGPTYLHVLDGSTGILRTINISDPTSPSVVGSYESDASVVEMTLDGDVAYLTTRGDDGLRLVDLSDPTSPAEAGFVPLDRAALVAAGDGMAYVSHFDDDSLRVVDVSDANAPSLVAGVELDTNLEFATDMAYQDGALFAASASEGVAAIDVTTPADPVVAGTYDVDGRAMHLTFLDDGTAYVAAAEAGFLTLDAEVSSVAVESTPTVETFHLTAAPNPFTEQAQLTLEVPTPQHVRVAVFDVLGRSVRTLHEGQLPAGRKHHLTFQAGDLPSGVYFLRATGEGVSTVRKVVRVD